MESSYDPKKYEKEIFSEWEKRGEFDLPKDLSGKKYIAIMAPPNITGSLHLGHALENTMIDVLIRSKRMRGFKTVWIPGTDHAGIATQHKVEKELKNEGLRKEDLGREKFTERVWQWKEKYGGLILEQFKKLGISANWPESRFTLDKEYQKEVLSAFVSYYEKGWIYRGKRVVNWCPRCQTSLSDLEVEYKEEKGKLWYIRYPIVAHRPIRSTQGRPEEFEGRQAQDDNDYIIVATTRPETMLGDAAVAVNPNDSRYKSLLGKKARLPLVKREIPIVADLVVDPKFGTGAVKVTPSHSIVDSEIAQRHKLEFFEVIDEKGKIKNVPVYNNLSIAEARKKVVEDLKKENLIEKEEDFLHSVGHCYRCQTVLENLPSEQWFLKMEELSKLAIDAVKKEKVKIIPQRWEGPYFNWLENIRDWCISRQLWWGHRLPVWFHEPKCVPKKGREEETAKCQEWVVSINEPKCDHCDAKFIQSEDVLDTWFSSALWPFAVLYGKDQREKFYPADLVSSAPEILHLWITRMIFSGMFFQKKEPFKTVFIHATVLMKSGQRMSKSLGVGIDPLELIEKYSADALRFGLMWQLRGNQDIRFDEAAVESGRRFANKIWNASRFVLQKTASLKEKVKEKDLASEDKEILKSLAEIEKAVEKHIESFEMGQALEAIYQFFWHVFCDVYLEKTKKRQDSSALWTLKTVLEKSLNLIWPFMPFVSEAVKGNFPNND